MLRTAPDGSFYLPRPNPAIEAAMDQNYQRVPGELRWVKKLTFIEKAKSLASALTSGQADEPTFEARMESCLDCKGIRRAPTSGALYCGLCGCGRHRLAELHTKLKLKGARCPISRW